MLSTANEIYTAFLEGIRKQRTSSVRPEVFVNIWNIWGLLKWINSIPQMKEDVEISQAEIDDFAMLRKQISLGPVTTNRYNLPDGNPIGSDLIDVDGFPPPNPSSYAPPKYRRALNIMFKLNYGANANQECGLTGDSTGYSDWMMAKLLRSDHHGVTLGNSYMRPSDTRLFYQRVQNQIVYVKAFSTQSDSAQMFLDYFHYPQWMSYSDGAFTYALEFSEEQVSAVLEIAISYFLERTKDPRWQTHLQNEALSAQIK